MYNVGRVDIYFCLYFAIKYGFQLEIRQTSLKASQLLYGCYLFSNAMVTNHLRAPYDVYFTKTRTWFLMIFRHRTVPGEI